METLFPGFTRSDRFAWGVSDLGKRGMAVSVSQLQYDRLVEREPDVISFLMAHEAGHCFGLLHTPSPNAVGYLDHAYPYGGGAAGGWGYTTHTDVFLAEDDHVP
jgi:hypothetical protein